MTRVIALSIGPRGRQFLGLFVGVLVLVSSTHPAAGQGHLWSQRFGDTDNDVGRSVTTDGSGNVVVTGGFNGTVNFGGVPLTSAGAEDIFLAKYDASGNHLWSKRFGDTSFDRGWSVTTDGSGNVFVTGLFQGTVDFGGGPVTSAGGWDIFLSKYDANGTHVWTKRSGDTSNQSGASVTTDGSGNVVFTGLFQGTVDLGGVPLASAGGADIFLAKYDSDGNHLWSQRFGDTTGDEGRSVTTDGSGNVVVTGLFQGTVDFGGVPLTSAGEDDVFLAKYDSGGNHQWSQRFGDTGFDQGLSVAIDGLGNVVVTGLFQGTVNFGGVPLTSAGGFDIFLATYDSGATHLWSKRFGDTSTDVGWSVATDGSRNVVVTGEFRGTVDFGGGPLTSGPSSDIFLATYDSGATHLWSRQFGGTISDQGLSVTTDGSGNVVVTGDFQGTVDFGGVPLTSAGAQDVFLAKFGPAADECPATCVGPRITVSDAQGRTGDIVFVEVGVQESPADIDTFLLELTYDFNMLRFVGCEPGELTRDWVALDCAEQIPGIITVGGFDPSPLGAGTTGSLARLLFEVRCEEGDVSQLLPSNFADDIEGMDFCCGTFRCVVCVSDGCVGPRITVSDAEGRAGDVVFVEVGVQESPMDIDAFGFDLSYDTNMLRFVGCERGDLTMGWTGFDCFENTPGTITLGAFDPKPVGTGVTGSLARLAFEVQCEEGDVSELVPSELTDDIEGMEFCCGAFTCVICVSDGDVNNDGLITPGDAQCALEIFTHKETVPADCDVPDWECEVIAAEVKCDGVVTPSDALAIFNRFLAGGGPEECFARPVLVAGTSPDVSGVYEVWVGRVVTVGSNEILVPVVMEASRGQAAFGFELTYDPEKLRYEGISLSVAGRAWAALTAHEVTPGQVIVGGFDPRGLSVAAVAGGREGDGTVELAGLRFRKLGEEYTLEEVRWIEQILKRESGEDDPGERGDRVTQFSLGRPFPNPMRSAISAFVSAPTGERHRVKVSIYDVQGRLVKTLLNSELGGGTHEVSWDRRNVRGHPVSSGIYFVQMKVGGRGVIDTKKVVVLR